MKKTVLICIISILFLMATCSKNRFIYPEARKENTTDIYFGKEISDPYRWLEDPNSAETKKWIAEENALTFDYLNKIPYREKIKNRLLEVYNYSKSGTPFKKSGKYFYLKNEGLQNHDILYVQETLNSEPLVLLDPNKLDKDGKYSLGESDISKNGKWLAFSISQGGSDWREILIKNIGTGEMLSDTIKWVKFSNISWYRDGFFYSRYPEPLPDNKLTDANKNHQVYYHKLGTPQAEDILYYENAEYPNRILSVTVTNDERYLVIEEVESNYGNQLYIRDLTDKTGEIICIAKTFDYENHIIGNIENKFFLHTNNNAPKYKLQVFTIGTSGNIEMAELIPESENLLEKIHLAGNKLAAKYLIHAHAEMKVFDLKGQFLYNIGLPALGDINEFKSDYNDNEAFYTFTSYIHPTTVYKYDVVANSSNVFFKPQLDYSENDYITELKFYTSKDGTKVPLFISYKKGLERNGDNPTLLFGYGGFNIPLLPRFYPYMIVWMENGGIFANANIRGGGEYGAAWHKAGTKLNKQNVFDDFIAAAEYLIHENYTTSEKLAIEGRSNGGLLVGAVVNQRPELFKVALPMVGVMDMLRFSKFTIGWAWEGDYGSVNIQEEFENLLSISPLHNIRSGIEYPAIFVTTAERDDRVVPAHSFKYIAALQEGNKGKNPVMIRIQTDAGHGAGKPIAIQIEERSDILTFIFNNMKINM